VTESDFYYRSMLLAIELRNDRTTAPSPELLLAVASDAFQQARNPDVDLDIHKLELYRAALIKTAVVAMRLATRS
jgi:hypothetical protein